MTLHKPYNRKKQKKKITMEEREYYAQQMLRPCAESRQDIASGNQFNLSDLPADNYSPQEDIDSSNNQVTSFCIPADKNDFQLMSEPVQHYLFQEHWYNSGDNEVLES